ncbi:condensin subunit Smc [Oceanospirillum multiglobuliferum]|uniref:Chromosome partition protein Smc n=1 Tax=Oceanospirillum multiglobuliferum TaxID=64969 RepID=A0A1T4L6I9_9GAMM|nr:chromosome segregation protein SMC [Oceanospirillum multiglobuliferum]OPX56779.1 chromosome segregation protein SMC [Oceanospirillum multiglobuliferum]SJZ50223.1 condensin subunit Smc [Oceanospirillum multiglobuliferum]
MRLKCIRLSGFKSFVDATTVPFSKNMTCVVGPNGCGKSNIIDAVRWVMGESSAKHLRGESMTDVIFNGSTSRKPVGQASIELVFDNSDGSLQGQYGQYAEIALKRQVTRDGQSNYFLNGTKCRRKDITEIFMGTGLGPRSYAIIEQGMISRLIDAKPEELRATIEEAAGISKYKERRKETESRMRRTHENLERLQDIRDELERQLQRLQRQAEAAQRYRELKSQDRRLKGQLRAIRWRDLDFQIRQFVQVIGDLEQQSEKHLFALRRSETEIESSRQQHQTANDQLEQLQAVFYELGNQITRLEQQMSHRQQRGQQLQIDLAEVDRNLQESRYQQEQDQLRLQEVERQLETVLPDFELQQARCESLELALESSEEQVQAWQNRWDNFNQQAQQYQREAELAQSRIQQHDRTLQELNQRRQRLQTQLAELSAPELEDEELALLQERALEHELNLEQLEESTFSLKEQLQDCREQLSQQQQQLDQARSQQQINQGRLASLQALQEAALADDDPQLQQWLADQNLDQAPKLAQQLEVTPRWALAVETVLADQLQALSCKSLQLPELAHHLEQQLEHWPQANIAFHLQDQAQNLPVEQTLAAQVQIQGAVPEALYLVVTADNVQQAFQRLAQLPAGYSVITESGIWLGKGWLRYQKGNQQAQGVLNRGREIEQLLQQQETTAQTLLELELKLEELQQQQVQIEQQVSHQADQRMLAQKHKSDLDSQIRTRQLKLEQFNERQRHLNEELMQVQERIAEEEITQEETREHWQIALEKTEEFAEQKEQLQTDREQFREQYERQRQSVRIERDSLHQLALRKQELTGQQQLAQSGVERLELQIERLLEKREQLIESFENIQEPKEDSEILLDELIEQRTEKEEQLLAVREKTQQLNDHMRQLEKSRGEHERELERVRTELEKMRMQQQALSVQREGINEQLDEIGGDLESLLTDLPEDATASVWQQRQEEVSEKIKRLGAINLAAIEEYEAQLERKQYLDGQNTELTEALGMLEEAIRKIDKETRQRFKQTFDEVNGWLQKLFPKVFGGGSAWLALTGDDLLETGVSIMARPPGKKNSTIHLLSGGEKALTAIALVFSIFQLNPAPFCMLDEVDAPLDDANVGRYARMVKEMSAHLQFIYISHNKIAMEMADHLMGVTMQEPGVSRIVAVDIDEATALVDV